MSTDSYRVVIADNFHYMDSEEYVHLPGQMSLAEAVETARTIVDAWLDDALKQGTPAEELYQQYTMFGDDPFIVGPHPTGEPPFSAWSDAREQCGRLLAAARTGNAGGAGHREETHGKN